MPIFYSCETNFPQLLLLPLKKCAFTWIQICIGNQSGNGSILGKNLDLVWDSELFLHLQDKILF